jgi:hypothetical protein
MTEAEPPMEATSEDVVEQRMSVEPDESAEQNVSREGTAEADAVDIWEQARPVPIDDEDSSA